jgi:hypothetical protein
MSLVTKSIMFGTFVNTFNELYKLQYSMDHLSYLDCLSDYKNGLDELNVHNLSMPKVFSIFESAGNYNGILLRKGLLKTLFFRMMDGLTEYMEKGFQSRSDHGIVSDHTFKFAKGIQNYFTASYTVLSLSGFININRPTYTKGNSEIEPVLRKYKQARENAGVDRVDRYEGDGGGDRHLYGVIFKADLARGVQRYQPTSINGLVRIRLPENARMEIVTKTGANQWALAIISSIAGASLNEICVGLDCEWNRDSSELTRTLALSFPASICESPAVVINLSRMGVFEMEQFPVSLKSLLELPAIIPVGVQVGNDISRLAKLGVKMTTFRDDAEIAKQLQDEMTTGYSLAGLCAQYLQVGVDKHGQNGDYSLDPLPDELFEYAALDAYLSRILYECLAPRLAACAPPQEGSLCIGKSAMYKYRGRYCAEVEILFVGATNGEKRKWGTTTIGRAKTLE